MMLDLFVILSKLLRYRRLHINGVVFRLHCTLTVLLLMSFFIVNSTKQLLGTPIICDVDKESVDKDLLNSYCYIRSTYSIVDRDRSLVYPGIATSGLSRNNMNSHQKVVYHHYYQWVWCLCLIQAVCFYFPRWLWKACESDKMSSLVSNLNYFTVKAADIEAKSELIAEYICKTMGTNNWYAIKYYSCESLALFNVIVQIFVIDVFVCGQFLYLGFEFILYLWSDPTFDIDPVLKVFPILSKCSFSRYGITGNNENLNSLCLLSINLLNQKIFIFLWFWFFFLAIVTTFVIAFRLVLVFCPLMRYQCCRHRFDFDSTNINRSQRLVVDKLCLGNWFILYLLSHNIEPIVFRGILERIDRKLSEQVFDDKKTSLEIKTSTA